MLQCCLGMGYYLFIFCGIRMVYCPLPRLFLIRHAPLLCHLIFSVEPVVLLGRGLLQPEPGHWGNHACNGQVDRMCSTNPLVGFDLANPVGPHDSPYHRIPSHMVATRIVVATRVEAKGAGTSTGLHQRGEVSAGPEWEWLWQLCCQYPVLAMICALPAFAI